MHTRPWSDCRALILVLADVVDAVIPVPNIRTMKPMVLL